MSLLSRNYLISKVMSGTLSHETLSKAKEMPVGTIRLWGKVRMQKVGPDAWKELAPQKLPERAVGGDTPTVKVSVPASGTPSVKPSMVGPTVESSGNMRGPQRSPRPETKVEGIRFTIREDHPVKSLQGKTLEGGVPQKIILEGKGVDVVVFTTCVDGKQVSARISTNPGLEEAVSEYRVRVALARKADEAALESAVPGLAEILRLSESVSVDEHRYSREMNEMMEDERNDGVRPTRSVDESKKEKLRKLLATHERASLYVRAKRQKEGAHWADNTGAGMAGEDAMNILASGGAIEDAKAALAVRRTFVD